MSKFKIGDKVVCINIDYSENKLKKNKIYTILDIDEEIDHIFIKKGQGGWFSNRFELAYKKQFSNKLEELINE